MLTNSPSSFAIFAIDEKDTKAFGSCIKLHHITDAKSVLNPLAACLHGFNDILTALA